MPLQRPSGRSPKNTMKTLKKRRQQPYEELNERAVRPEPQDPGSSSR